MADVRKIVVDYVIPENSLIEEEDLEFGISDVNTTNINSWSSNNEFPVEVSGNYVVSVRANGTILMTRTITVRITDTPYEKLLGTGESGEVSKTEHNKSIVSSVTIKNLETNDVIIHPVKINNQQTVFVEPCENPIIVIIN